jgi:hypothetical protein
MFQLPYTTAQWSDTINESGSLQIGIQYSQNTLKIPKGLYDALKMWGAIIAVHRTDPTSGDEEVKHAGPLIDYDYDAIQRKLSLTCGGGWSLMTIRLALSHDLDPTWTDGTLLIDEDHGAGAWTMLLNGTYSDISRKLVNEAMKWGALPITLPELQENGNHQLQLNGFDLTPVSDRLADITALADGPEIRFDPRITESGYLTFDLRVMSEIIDHQWLEGGTPGAWDSSVPGQRVRLVKVTGKGENMANQVYVAGGKSGDKTIICRKSSDPSPVLLQVADKTRTTVTDLNILRSAAVSDIAYGSHPDETMSIEVGEEYHVMPGDIADLRVDDDFMGEKLLHLKITDVSGDSSKDLLTVQARSRG